MKIGFGVLSRQTSILSSRFGLGARLKDVVNDIAPSVETGDLLNEVVGTGTTVTGQWHSSSALLAQLEGYRAVKKKFDDGEKDAVKVLPKNPSSFNYNLEIDKRFLQNYISEKLGLSERLVMFWTNHFAVSAAKSQLVRILVGAYEREAIRPNISGRFIDLAMAVLTHPAMLAYLDNNMSVGPNSRESRGKRGLNENLAREIMELHLLGVDSGYSQADVTAFSKALTGWTFLRTPQPEDNNDTAFRFMDKSHEPGSQSVLGNSYPNDGFFQAADIIVDLCARPAAANHVARKLVRHFIADEPPQQLVQNLSETFMQTNGDLLSVYQALLEAPESSHPQSRKFRTPQEWLIASMRATNVKISGKRLRRMLNDLGQPLWNPPGPNGYSDETSQWLSPLGLATRLSVSEWVADNASDIEDPRRFVENILGETLTEATRTAISRADNPAQGIAMTLMSPEFLRR